MLEKGKNIRENIIHTMNAVVKPVSLFIKIKKVIRNKQAIEDKQNLTECWANINIVIGQTLYGREREFSLPP